MTMIKSLLDVTVIIAMIGTVTLARADGSAEYNNVICKTDIATIMVDPNGKMDIAVKKSGDPTDEQKPFHSVVQMKVEQGYGTTNGVECKLIDNHPMHTQLQPGDIFCRDYTSFTGNYRNVRLELFVYREAIGKNGVNPVLHGYLGRISSVALATGTQDDPLAPVIDESTFYSRNIQCTISSN